MADLRSLSKPVITTELPDIVSKLFVLVPGDSNLSPNPIDSVRLEPYIRLQGLPADLIKIIKNVVAAEELSSKIQDAIPTIGKASLDYHPNGMAELQWKFSDGTVLGIMVSSTKFQLSFDKEFAVIRESKIGWRFSSPKRRPEVGEFKNEDELLDFLKKSVF